MIVVLAIDLYSYSEIDELKHTDTDRTNFLTWQHEDYHLMHMRKTTGMLNWYFNEFMFKGKAVAWPFSRGNADHPGMTAVWAWSSMWIPGNSLWLMVQFCWPVFEHFVTSLYSDYPHFLVVSVMNCT